MIGADIMSPMNNEYVDIPSTRGNLGFTGQFTGNAIADFLLGYARSAELSNDEERKPIVREAAVCGERIGT